MLGSLLSGRKRQSVSRTTCGLHKLLRLKLLKFPSFCNLVHEVNSFCFSKSKVRALVCGSCRAPRGLRAAVPWAHVTASVAALGPTPCATEHGVGSRQAPRQPPLCPAQGKRFSAPCKSPLPSPAWPGRAGSAPCLRQDLASLSVHRRSQRREGKAVPSTFFCFDTLASPRRAAAGSQHPHRLCQRHTGPRVPQVPGGSGAG